MKPYSGALPHNCSSIQITLMLILLNKIVGNNHKLRVVFPATQGYISRIFRGYFMVIATSYQGRPTALSSMICYTVIE